MAPRGTTGAPFTQRSRLDRVATHLVPLPASRGPCGDRGALSTWCGASFDEEVELRRLFGPSACCDAPLMATGGGRRYRGVDLTPALSPEQARFVVNALARHRLVSFAEQNLDTFSLIHFERLASHFGAVVPHPNNYSTGSAGTYADPDGSIELMPVADRLAARVNETFPGQLQALAHTSPAVLTVSNFSGPPKPPGAPVVPPGIGGGFHSDIEYEPLPIYVSMFLVQAAPSARSAPGSQGATWVSDPGVGDISESSRFYRHNRPLTHELHTLRMQCKPLNGETAFVDTAAAFDALPDTDKNYLETIRVIRRMNGRDSGFAAPLVRTNRLSGLKSLHSPWNCRRGGVPDLEIPGMSQEESGELFDRIELHCLQPRYRYNHLHRPGDVTIWDNFMTLHAVPPIKSGVSSVEDARLMYRLSCKGDPCFSLPREDAQPWVDEHIATSYRTPIKTQCLGV